MNALARDDEGSGAWCCIEACVVESESRDDHDKQRDDGDQVDLAGIVAPVTVIAVADFPAHDLASPAVVSNQSAGEAAVPRAAAMRISLGSAAAIALHPSHDLHGT
jgi:hypothetical protein